MPAERLFLLDLGWLEGDVGWFLPGARGGGATRTNRNPSAKWVQFPVTAGLIEHKDGLVLFDVGAAPDAMQSHPQQTMNFPVSRFEDENRLERQLAAAGFKPEDVGYIILSHLHWDHIGQFSAFKGLKIPLIVQKRELEWALYSIWMGKSGYYALEDMESLVGAEWYPIDEDSYELMDGIVLEWTGGHTPGHQIAKVGLKSGKKYILTGDYLHIPEEYETETKGWLLSDAEEWQVALRKIKLEAMARKSQLIIGHDPKIWEKFPKAPKAMT